MNSRGFTLIELLVVISIISLISSIILSSVQDARRKAELAAAIKFATNNHRTLGPTIIDLSFSENTGTLTYDGKANATLNGPSWVSSYNRGAGSALDFDGINDQVFGSIDGSVFSGDFTITAWFKHDAMTQWGSIFSNSVSVNNTPLMTMRNQTTQFGINQVGVLDDGVFVDLGPQHYNKWIYGVISRKGNTLYVYAYLDGKLIKNSGPLNWTLNSTNQYYIGRHWDGGHYFDGTIDDVRVYDQALSLSYIEKQYLANADKNLENQKEYIKVVFNQVYAELEKGFKKG